MAAVPSGKKKKKNSIHLESVKSDLGNLKDSLVRRPGGYSLIEAF